MSENPTIILIQRLLIALVVGSLILGVQDYRFWFLTSFGCLLVFATVIYNPASPIQKPTRKKVLETLPQSIVIQLSEDTKSELSERTVEIPNENQSKMIRTAAEFVQIGIIPMVLFGTVYIVFADIGVIALTSLVYGIITAVTVQTLQRGEQGVKVTEDSHPNLSKSISDVCDSLGISNKPVVRLTPSNDSSFIIDTAIPFYNKATLHFTDYIHHYVDTVLETAESKPDGVDGRDVVKSLIKDSEMFYLSDSSEIPDMRRLTPELEWILYHELAHIKQHSRQYPSLLYLYLLTPIGLSIFAYMLSPHPVEFMITAGLLSVGFELIINWDSRNSEYKSDELATEYTSLDHAVLTMYMITDVDPFTEDNTTVFSGHPSIQNRIYNLSENH